MGAPNLLQQLYLKTALNESKDGMFDHTADLEEGYQRKRMRVIRKAISSTGSGDRSQMKPEVADFLARSFKKKRMRNKVLSGGKGEVDALMVRARKKIAALNAKGIAEALDEGYHKKSLRLIRAGNWESAAEQGDRAEASALMRGGASKRTMKRHFNDQDYAAGTKAMNKFEKAAAKKRKAAGITEGLLSKLERLEEGYTSRGGYSKSMTSRILRDNSRSPENRAARAAARAAALKAAAARAAAAKTPDTKN